ncbi:outer membrane protein [uncultured Devosia sp.]|uniref:outer membrane protein n=1 Tax=uncultured Devosia sp. TaxID=211434 RepID=UPI0026057161|nr:outer membrane protein [uncultured Devosia sp.]
MLKFTKFFVPVMLGLASMASASAADLSYDFPQLVEMPETSFDWNGFYAGVYAGYATGRATSTNVVNASASTVDVRGGLLGGTLGGNAQFGNFVLGLEGDLAWSDVNGSQTCSNAPGFDCIGRMNWVGSGKLRGGVALDRVLLFGTAGLAVGGITASTNPAPGGSTGTFSSTVWGWTAGAGAEVAVTDAISVKAEYAYYDFATVQAPINTIANTGATDIKSNAHALKLGVNYRF